MGRNNKIQMPSSQGGLVRYFDDYKSKVEISPKMVVVLCVLVGVLVLLLEAFKV